MSQATNDILFRIEEYRKNAYHYYENSKNLLAKNELSKAGELLWGAIAELSKAFSLTYGTTLPSHQKIREFFRELRREYKDIELDNQIKSVEALHVNFYENWLDEEDFKEDYSNAEDLLKFIDLELEERLKK